MLEPSYWSVRPLASLLSVTSTACGPATYTVQIALKLKESSELYGVLMSNSVLLRTILKEMQKACSSPQFRQNKHTTEQNCSPMHYSLQLADTYLTLLQSVARHRELVNTYKCREKTTSEAANLVGLSLPQTYNDQ